MRRTQTWIDGEAADDTRWLCYALDKFMLCASLGSIVMLSCFFFSSGAPAKELVAVVSEEDPDS